MTAYTTITNGEIDQNSPITQPLMTALRDNPTAIAETDTTAPMNRTAWHIEDGTGGTDPIYDHAVDGDMSNIATPTFDSMWEYMLIGEGLSPTSGTRDLYYKLYRGASPGGQINMATATADNWGFQIYIFAPQWNPDWAFARWIAASDVATSGNAANGTSFEYSSGGLASNAVEIGFNVGVIGSGKIWMLKRAVYAGR